MTYLPSQTEWEEVLSAPHMARLTRAHGESRLELTLIARCRTLEIKYAIQSQHLSLFPFKSENGIVCYGLVVPDDAIRPMVLWAACRDFSELAILQELESENTLTIHLYNEACVNVASAKFCTQAASGYGAYLENPAFEPDRNAITANEVRSSISRGILDASSMLSLSRLEPWTGAMSHLIGEQRASFALDLFSDEEGGHQEQLTGWLGDSVQPDLLELNLKYVDGKKNKEFADVTMSYISRSVLIESKTLAILRRSALPLREHMKADVDKKIRKAVKQLKGGCRSLHNGKAIINGGGKEIQLSRGAPAHAICLIPDNSLLTDPSTYAAAFCREFARVTGDIFHILDLGQLYRIVQAAQMLSDQFGGSIMDRFDSYLMQRSEIVVELNTVCFDMALDLTNETARIRVTQEST